jgi:hypothetical protein
MMVALSAANLVLKTAERKVEKLVHTKGMSLVISLVEKLVEEMVASWVA